MNSIAEGISSPNATGVLVAYVGREQPEYRRPTVEDQVQAARVRAARRGGSYRWSTSPAGRAQRVREIERLVGSGRRPANRSEVSTERRVLPPGHRYADNLPGSWPTEMFSPQKQREIRAMIASVRDYRRAEYR